MRATLRRTWREFREDNLADEASALTYYAVLSLFSALMGLVVLVGLVGDPHTVTNELTSLVRSLGPPSAVRTFEGPIRSLGRSHNTAGFLLVVNVGSALWTASGYVGSFMRTANVIYEVEEERSSVTLRPLQMILATMIVVLLALVLVALVLTGSIARKVGAVVGVSPTTVLVWDVVKWPVMLVVVSAVVAGLFYSGPNAKLRGLRSIVPGVALTVVVWLAAAVGFAVYIAYFNSYNITYGALGALVGLLVALWVMNLAVLLGSEINAERERTRQLAAGLPATERELRLEQRAGPGQGDRSRPA